MSLECLYKDIEWCNSHFYKSDDCLCDANIIVPDSMSDILKIVSVKATPLISDTKSVPGRIEITGQLRFNVLYIAEEEKSPLCSICTTIPFSHVIASNDITDEEIPVVTPDYATTSFTLINSRKLKLSALLRFCAETYHITRTKILSEAPLAQVQSDSLTVPAYRVICSKNIVVSSNADLPAGKPAISKILKQNARIIDSDFKILNNKAIVKGNLSLGILYEGEYVTDATVSIPFTEVVEAEGLSPSLTGYVKITAVDWDIKPDTDLSGDYKMLDATVVLSVIILAYSNQSFSFVKDIFLPGSSLTTDKNSIKALLSKTVYNEEEFIKDTLTLPPESASIVKIIDMDATPCDYMVSDNSVSLNCEITILYLTDDTASPVNAYTTKIPVSHQFTSCAPQNVKLDVKHTGYAITSNNSIDVRLGLGFEFSCTEQISFTHITSCEESDYTPEKRASILVSVVNSGDSLWDIAKKYNISLSHLASANALDENAILTVGEKLIIPR